jgi:hypothetical protein
VICVYLFDPIFNEANESSSACEPGIKLHVETNTPPVTLTIAERLAIASEEAGGGILEVGGEDIAVTTRARRWGHRRYSYSKSLYWKNLMTNGYS